MDKKTMIEEIMLVCKANNVHNAGDIFFTLAFKNEGELKKICLDLHINTEA